MKYSVFLLGLALSVSGCSISLIDPPQQPETRYVLVDRERDAHDSAPDARAARIDRVLYIQRATAPAYLDSSRIVFSENALTRSSYQFASWVEPPAERFTALLADRLERRGILSGVTRHPSAVQPDLLMIPELTEFRHETSESPGAAIVTVKLELIDLDSRRILGSTALSRSIPARSYSAQGAVESFSDAVTQILDETERWLVGCLREHHAQGE